MLFYWIFSLSSLAFLLTLELFFNLHENTYFYLLAFSIFVSIPAFIPLVGHIRKDIQSTSSLFTRVGISLLAVFIAILFWSYFLLHFSLVTIFYLAIVLLGIFFTIESRIYFLWAILALVVTICSLVFHHKHFAETASILLYILLVAGVLIEITSPIFKKLHKNSKTIIQVSTDFALEYKKEFAGIMYFFSIFLACAVVIMLLLQGKVWHVELKNYFLFATGSLISFVFYLFLSPKIKTFQDFLGEIDILTLKSKSLDLKVFWVYVVSVLSVALSIYLFNSSFLWFSVAGLIFLISLLISILYFLLLKYAK